MRMFTCVVAVLSATVSAQQPSVFASRVVAFDDRGQAGGGTFQPTLALGAPGGASDVHSLGVGGSLTLGFDVVLVDGPGADLIVAENPFTSTTSPWESFAELCFVEVSSDGQHFARLPSRYTGPATDPGPFAFLHSGWFSGLGGVGGVDENASDLQDVVLAGGDAFDLQDLAGDPLVLGGQVVLSAIQQVRLVDVRSGIDVDSQGVAIHDTGGGSADIDAVTVVQHAASQSAQAPRVDLSIPADGNFDLTISDPDGIAELDPSSLHVSLWGIVVDPAVLFEIGVVTQVTPTSFTLRLGGALHSSIPLRMAVSLRDQAGHRSGASRVRP